MAKFDYDAFVRSQWDGVPKNEMWRAIRSGENHPETGAPLYLYADELDAAKEAKKLIRSSDDPAQAEEPAEAPKPKRTRKPVEPEPVEAVEE